jgi:hypothetical protein
MYNDPTDCQFKDGWSSESVISEYIGTNIRSVPSGLVSGGIDDGADGLAYQSL